MSTDKEEKSLENESAVIEQSAITVIVPKQVKKRKLNLKDNPEIMIFEKE